MRLKPAVTADEALEWLTGVAILTWGVEATPELEATLTRAARAMAAVSAVDVPDEIDPLFR